jgi:hypothetical protein
MVAVHAGVGSASAQPCPDLSGTYAVAQTAWIDAFHLNVTGTARPKGQAPQLATLRPRDGGYTLIWHMPRKEFMAAADQLSLRDPRNYGLWLDMTLGNPSQSTTGGGEQDWYNRVAFLGPVFRVDVLLPHKQCEGGWFLVGTQGRAGPADVAGGMDGNRDAQLWLQRRNDGALVLRWRERRKLVVISETRYSTESSIPLWAKDHLDSWPAAPAPASAARDLAPLREDEMPARNRPPKCRVDTELANQFQDRLKANLPAGALHRNRAIGGVYIGRMREDGTCEPMPYHINISALSTADLDKVEAFLKAEPLFARLESQQSETLPDGRLVRIFKMVVEP